MKTELRLYNNLLNKVRDTELSYELNHDLKTIFVEYERNAYALMQVHNGRYIAGVGYYCEDDNSFDYSNVRCPEFDDVDDAIDWLASW